MKIALSDGAVLDSIRFYTKSLGDLLPMVSLGLKPVIKMDYYGKATPRNTLKFPFITIVAIRLSNNCTYIIRPPQNC